MALPCRRFVEDAQPARESHQWTREQGMREADAHAQAHPSKRNHHEEDRQWLCLRSKDYMR